MNFTKLVPRVLITAIIAIAALAALAVPVAAEVPAPQLLIVRSGLDTQTAGYAADITEDGSQIEAASYSGAGVWSNAAVVTQHPAWAPFPAPDSADWVSTTAANYGVETAGEGNAWRLFKQEFNLPAIASSINGTIKIAADNAFEVYLNGSLVASSAPAAPVYGEVDLGSAVSAHTTAATFNIYPVPGDNVLKFVVRNWNNNGVDNPSGLAFNANIIYSNIGSGSGDPGDPGEGDNSEAWYLESSYHSLTPEVTLDAVGPNHLDQPPFFEMIQDSTVPNGSVTISGNVRTWIANLPVEGDFTYSAGAWTLTLYTNQTAELIARIGAWDPETGFIEGTEDVDWFESDTYNWVVPGEQIELTFEAGALTIPDGDYLALQVAAMNGQSVTSGSINGDAPETVTTIYTNSTDGLSNLLPPGGEPTKPVPELPAVALLALGLAVIGAVIIIRNRVSAGSRA
jgi:hypothetical protein